MKRILAIALALVLCLSLLSVTALAAPSASLTGPGTVRAGDTITLTLNISGSGIFGASGTVNFDSSVLELTGTKQLIAAPWMVEFNGNTFVAYDNNLTNPINSGTALLSLTFKVKSGAAVGAALKVSVDSLTTSDGVADSNLGSAVYSTTVAAPMSGDNALASLTVSNAEISPAFSADVTSYTASVPFAVERLEIAATAADGKAKVSVNSPNLVPGGTTDVTVVVTAENGAAKIYTISVTREQDPNYVASTNNDLTGITVEGFLLSPVFSAEVTEYVVWLPYEVENIVMSATAADGKASVRIEGGAGLTAGADNVVKVICTAEDGTEKVYHVIAKRAAAHDGSTQPTEPPTTEPATTVPPTSAAPETTAPETTTPATEPAPVEPGDNGGVGAGIVVLIALLCFLAGAAVMYFVKPQIDKLIKK